MSFKSSYKLAEMIGKGHHSSVFKCIHKKTKKEFACKIVTGCDIKRTVFDENNSQICHHPNINEIYGVYYTVENGQDKKYIVSELGEGDLFNFVEKKKHI